MFHYKKILLQKNHVFTCCIYFTPINPNSLTNKVTKLAQANTRNINILVLFFGVGGFIVAKKVAINTKIAVDKKRIPLNIYYYCFNLFTFFCPLKNLYKSLQSRYIIHMHAPPITHIGLYKRSPAIPNIANTANVALIPGVILLGIIRIYYSQTYPYHIPHYIRY